MSEHREEISETREAPLRQPEFARLDTPRVELPTEHTAKLGDHLTERQSLRSGDLIRRVLVPRFGRGDGDLRFPDDPFLENPWPNPRWVKFTILRCDRARVYFQDSGQFKFHYDFATKAYEICRSIGTPEYGSRALTFADAQGSLAFTMGDLDGAEAGADLLLALEAGLPIVPISVSGSRHVMRKGRLATYPARVRLVVHEPIVTRGLEGTDAKVFGERIRQIIAPDAESDVTANDVHSRA